MKVQPKDGPIEASTKTLVATVDKIIPAIGTVIPEKAQISIEGAEHLYRELRVENILEDPAGNHVGLKKGAEVSVTISAEPEAVTKQ
jgi:hypothetical protein